MSRITLDDRRDGLGAFPAGFTVVARDDLGDALAVDADGKVWLFPHDTATTPWGDRSLAFATTALLHEHVAFQHHFELPPDADVATLRARKETIEQFVKGRKGAPYTRDAARPVLEDLRQAIADRRYSQSKRGRGLAECQALGQHIEHVLREAGAPGDWIARAAQADGSVLGLVGRFAPPWTEARVRELLAPLLGKRKLVCHERPAPKPEP